MPGSRVHTFLTILTRPGLVKEVGDFFPCPGNAQMTIPIDIDIGESNDSLEARAPELPLLPEPAGVLGVLGSVETVLV